MKKINILKILSLSFFIFILTGCHSQEANDKSISDAIKLSEEYYMDKYNEELKIEDFETSVCTYKYGLLPDFSTDKVSLYNKEEDFYIYVDLSENHIYDNRQTDEIKSDLKEYINKEYFEKNDINLDNTLNLSNSEMSNYHYIDLRIHDTLSSVPTDEYNYEDCFGINGYYNGNIKEFIENNELYIYLPIYFKSDEEIADNIYPEEIKAYEDKFKKVLNDIQEFFSKTKTDSYISFRLFAPDKYMNDDVKNILNKERTSWSEGDRYIYGKDYLYMSMVAKKGKDNSWDTSSIYYKYINIDEGLYASSSVKEKFESIEDVNYSKYPIYNLIYNKNEIKDKGHEDLLNKTKTNYEGKTVISNVYELKYNDDKYPDTSDEYINVKIDKEKFENGILLDKNNSLVHVSKDIGNNDFATFPFTEGLIIEDDKFIYLTLQSNIKFAVINNNN